MDHYLGLLAASLGEHGAWGPVAPPGTVLGTQGATGPVTSPCAYRDHPEIGARYRPKRRKELTFTVLSDPGNQVARQLGILTGPSDGTRAAQLQLGLDLIEVNADGTTGLPMPAVIIADASGTIRWIGVHRDYTTRTEPGQILQAITQTITQTIT